MKLEVIDHHKMLSKTQEMQCSSAKSTLWKQWLSVYKDVFFKSYKISNFNILSNFTKYGVSSKLHLAAMYFSLLFPFPSFLITKI